ADVYPPRRLPSPKAVDRHRPEAAAAHRARRGDRRAAGERDVPRAAAAGTDGHRVLHVGHRRVRGQRGSGARRTGRIHRRGGAADVAGHGQAVHGTIRNLGELSGTLADSREDLFGTVTELQTFVSMLAENDAEVREFNRRLEDVAGFLAAERGDLATAVREL